MNRIKKFLSIFISVVMVCSVINYTSTKVVNAATTQAGSYDYLLEDGYITNNADDTYTGHYPVEYPPEQ